MSRVMDLLPVITRNALLRAGYDEQILEKATEEELLSVRGVNRTGVTRIRDAQRKVSPIQIEHNRMWLAGTIAAGIAAGNQKPLEYLAKISVELADMLIQELSKVKAK